MKTLSLSFILAILFFGVSVTQAQQRGPRGQRGMTNDHFDKLKTELNLSEEQVSQITALHEEIGENIKAIKDDESLDRDEKREKIMELRKEQKTAMSGILTPEQQEKLKSLQAERREKMKKKQKVRKEAMADRHEELQKLRAEFDQEIDEDDRAKLAELREVFNVHKEKMKAGQKKTRGERGENKAKFKTEHEDEIEELKTLSEKYHDEVVSFLEENGFSKDDRGQRRKLNSEENAKGERSPNHKRKGHKQGRKTEPHRKISRFLLMDPEASGNAGLAPENKINVFPNPAEDWTSVTYNVRADGQVLVQIQDEQGNILKNLVNEKTEKGEYTVEFNTSELSNKNYFIVITDELGKTSKQFVKMK